MPTHDRLTTKQALEMIATLEGVGISSVAFLKSMKRAGVEKQAGRWDREAVLSARKAGKEADKSKGGAGPNGDLKRRKLELECEKLQVAVDQAKGAVIQLSDHERILSELGHETRQRMEMIPGSLAPLLTGKPTPIIADLLGKAIREALQQLADKADK